MRKQRLILVAILCLITVFTCAVTLSSCNKDKGNSTPAFVYEKNPDLDTSKEISLRLVGSGSSWAEMDKVMTDFSAIYPNCTVTYESVESYEKSLPDRLRQTELKADIFTTVNIQSGSELKDLALNLISEESKKILDLSGCNEGLVNNYKYTSAENTQYSIPYSALTRGMFVNKTLLAKYNLATPHTQSEFLNCCKVLTDNGHIALQCPPENLGQQLLYPSMCNKIANAEDYEATWNLVQTCGEGVSDMFEDEYEFFYKLVENGYINFSAYKKGKAFLNLEQISETEYAKVDDVGNIGFVVDVDSMSISLDKDIADYHSAIEYEFIVSPVSEEGGYAYLSPADGLAVNKNSDNPDWALEFLNYFFTPEINSAFAQASGIVSNTRSSETTVKKYGIPANHVSDVGQVTFDYGDAPNFYNTVTMLTRNGLAYDNNGIQQESYSSVNANYRSVFTAETYYRKLAVATYEPTTAQYMEQNPIKFYRAKAEYVEATSEYRTENPSETYYRNDAGNYVEADAAYITANPTTTIYKKVTAYVVADAAYRAANEAETYYRKITHVAVDNTYIEEHPTEKIYRRIQPMEGMAFMRVQDADGNFIKEADGTYQTKYTLSEYMDRLEKEFQIAKAYKYGATK